MINVTSIRAVALLAGALLLAGCGDGESTAETAQPAHYEIETFNGWPQDKDEEKVGRYLESAWHDPAGPKIILAVDSRPSGETGSPTANAELARIQTSELPTYRERGVKKVKLGGRPTVQWAFDISGESRIEFFFEECGTSFVVRGTTSPVSFEAISGSFRQMTATIKVACDE